MHRDKRRTNKPNLEFAERVKDLRKTARLTQVELAESCETHQAQVSRWENGLELPPRETLLRLATTLGVSVDFLLGNAHGAINFEEIGVEVVRVLGMTNVQFLLNADPDLVDAAFSGFQALLDKLERMK